MDWIYMDEAPPQEEGEYLVWNGVKHFSAYWIDGKWNSDEEIVKYVKIE